jgi:hypothetical protein
MTFSQLTTTILIGAALTCAACKTDNGTGTSPCTGVPATVKDLAGLDGCQFVFELADGTRLQPVMPTNDDAGNPLTSFTFTDGKKVILGYEVQANMASICMAGKMVTVTCLEEQP